MRVPVRADSDERDQRGRCRPGHAATSDGRNRARRVHGRRPDACPGPEHRRVAAFGDLDDDLIVLACGGVVFDQFRSQARHVHARCGVGGRIVRQTAIEDVHAEGVFLQRIAATGQRLVDRETEKPLEPLGLGEQRMGADAFELGADGARLRLIGRLVVHGVVRASRLSRAGRSIVRAQYLLCLPKRPFISAIDHQP